MRWVAFLVIFLLAGCTDNQPDELVINSTPEAVDEAQDAATGRQEQKGGIAGFVLSEDLRPVSNASVRIPGLDINVRSDRDGAFAFASLWSGPYRVVANATGYRGADAVIDVVGGETARVKFVLTPVPPPEPWFETFKFEGFADMTGDVIFGAFFCPACQFQFDIDEDADSLIIEAFMDQAPEGQSNSFRYWLTSDEGMNERGSALNPLRVEFEDVVAGAFDLEIEPSAFPVAETQKSFQVFVTHFHNGPAPEGWSIQG